MAAERFRLSRSKGWRMPEGGVSCARPSRYGNPWKIEPFMTWRSADEARAHAIELFRAYTLPDWTEEWRAALAGRPLGCYCRLDQPCHVDVILEWANP